MSSNIRISRICQFCGDEFIARTTVTKYCSHRCSSRAYKQRDKTKRIETSNSETISVLNRETAIIQSKEFLSIREASKLLSISRWTISRAVRDKRLNAVRFGRRIVIRREDIDRLFR